MSKPEARVTKDERLSFVALLAAGVLFFVWIGPSEIRDSENASISPRLLPYLYVGLIMVLATIGLISSVRRGAEGWAVTREQYVRFGIVLVALSFSAWLATINFWLAGIPTILVGLWLTDVREPRFIAIYTAGLIAVTWLLVTVTGINIR